MLFTGSMLLSMAWRNVLRNLRRSAITVSAIALGLAALLFLWGFTDGTHNSMVRNLQQVIVGSVQIQSKGFFKHPTLDGVLQDREKIELELDRLGAIQRTVRLYSFALAAGQDSSEGLGLLGIDPETEHLATKIHAKVSQGRFLLGEDVNTCVLGAKTASNLGLNLGDDVVLLVNDRFGTLSAEKFSLVGIIDSGEMGIDRGLAIVPISSMQTLLGMEGRITNIVIQLPADELEQTVSSLRASLDSERFEVLRWYDMYPVLKQWVELEVVFYYLFLSIVLLIVAAGIMNTIMMSTLDRVREFGVMMALGCSRLRLAGMVAIESVIIGVIGTMLGTVLGLCVVTFFGHVGIDVTSQMDTATRFYIDPVIHTEINLDHLLTTVFAVVIAALLAAVIPALRSARLEPVKAIHHV